MKRLRSGASTNGTPYFRRRLAYAVETGSSLYSQECLLRTLDIQSSRADKAEKLVANQRNIIEELKAENRSQKSNIAAFGRCVADMLEELRGGSYSKIEDLPQSNSKITPSDLAAVFQAFQSESVKNHRLEIQMRVLLEQVATLSQMREETRAQAVNLQAILQSITISLSWKLMLPARLYMRLFQRIRLFAVRREFIGHFDDRWYLRRYADVRLLCIDPLAHFLRFANGQFRDPNPYFSTRWYLANNPDVRAAGINGFVHFVRFGLIEGRDPHPNVSATSYRRIHETIISGNYEYTTVEPDPLFSV